MTGDPANPAEHPRDAPRRWLKDAGSIDAALYTAVASTPTPSLDRAMRELSRAANHSKLSMAAAAVLATTAGPTGRRAARFGLVSVGLTSAVVNMLVKPLSGRHRPDRVAERVAIGRQVRMPISTSFPSGHSAAAFAFATGVGHVMPRAAVPLRALAALVAYSRVHTGVHYPGDVVAGSLIGTAVAQTAVHALDRRRAA